jgi:hypothetical protein
MARRLPVAAALPITVVPDGYGLPVTAACGVWIVGGQSFGVGGQAARRLNVSSSVIAVIG